MKQGKYLFIIMALVLLTGAGCKTSSKKVELNNREISGVIDQMTELMVHDITNPPLAARFFSYACMAGYEVVRQNDTQYKSFYGSFNQYPLLRKPNSFYNYNYQVTAVLAMLEVAKKIQPSGSFFQTYETNWLDSLKNTGIAEEVLEHSKQYALWVSKQILAYAKSDGYNKISNYPRYTPLQIEGAWYPTPPAYIAAVEPYFKTVRPFTLDSCSQFKPRAPVPYCASKGSAFYRLMQLNYKDTLSEEHRMIAAFWDCNPFAVQDNGHLMVGLKKISPGAHWLGITGIACKKADTDFDRSMLIYTTVSVGLMDAFIGCWDEKYRSNRIRPETAIRKLIDPEWVPLLQTPPFPEYVSGHSVVSASSATILTHFFGDHFSYTDSVEMRYGLPPRKYSSFQQAAIEAGVSRFYGGIHFMDAIDQGRTLGLNVGDWVLRKMNLSRLAYRENYKTQVSSAAVHRRRVDMNKRPLYETALVQKHVD